MTIERGDIYFVNLNPVKGREEAGQRPVLVLSIDAIKRIISVRTLREYWELHRDIEGQLRAWYHRAKKADWQTSGDVKKDYPTASIVANNRVVFDITRNYRLVVKIRYNRGIIYIRFIGTHQEYDRIDVTEV